MRSEPTIAVGLVENAGAITLHLIDTYIDGAGKEYPPGEYHFENHSDPAGTTKASLIRQAIISTGIVGGPVPGGTLTGMHPGSRFRIPVTIGIDFHWQQEKSHTFCGGLHLLPRPGNKVTVVNEVPLESYLLSVCSSEMSAHSPEEFLKAHSIISRSWLCAQLAARHAPVQPSESVANSGEIIRWYDRQSHTDFDVCADDHCQRYQGTDLITTGTVSRAITATRGEVLMFNGAPCDARFSKCCGGITEDFRLAWSDTVHPYLVPIPDTPAAVMPDPPLSDEAAAREFIMSAPDAYCNCTDPAILASVLNNYDQSTKDFFRWRVRLTPAEIATLLQKKCALDLGRILALDPVERGLSGRIKRLKLTGTLGSIVIGKELEIRRALSPTHLYSSAFVIDTEGAQDHPDAFVLTGAGWGHGVGLCQIGAAVMAYRGIGYREILSHYYPGSTLERVYG